MIRLRVLDGMEADQHHGFQISEVEPLFVSAGLVLERHETFQAGLNHLFVFRKPREEISGPARDRPPPPEAYRGT
jgi:hypothetical protein